MPGFLEPVHNYMRCDWELNYGDENSGHSEQGEVSQEEP